MKLKILIDSFNVEYMTHMSKINNYYMTDRSTIKLNYYYYFFFLKKKS